MKKKQLKILMVKPLEGCAPHILRVLKEGQAYFLYNNYEESDADWIEKTDSGLPPDFFSIRPTDNTPQISISAIVGKNGDGKSSLIELIIRILNNFAKIYGFGGDTNNLIYISGINAELYFSTTREITETIYKIHIESNGINNSITLFKENEPIWGNRFEINNNKPVNIVDLGDYTQDDKDLFITDYFFTLVANYSLYAYNSYDYEEEWGWIKKKNKNSVVEEHQTCWLDSVFHKNDGYQTPIVLHPFRSDGNIDVNTEHKLTIQRLLSLFLTKDATEKSFRWVNERQFAKDITYTLNEESKLEKKIFYDFFRSFFYYDSYADQAVPPLKDIDDEIREYFQQNNTNINIKLAEKIQKELTTPLKKMYSFVIDNGETFDRAIKTFDRVVEDLKKERDNSQKIDRISDIQRFTIQVREVCSAGEKILQADVLSELNKYAEHIYHKVGKLNFNQFFQIVLVVFIQNEWKSRIPSLNNSIRHLNSLEKTLGDKAFDYLVYKTLSIIKKYPQYDHWYRFCYFQGYFFNNAEITSFEKEGYQKAIDEILQDKSHITLKLRQILNFLNYDYFTGKEHKLREYKKIIDLFDLKSVKKETSLNGIKTQITMKVGKCDFTSYYETIYPLCLNENNEIDDSRLIDFLPPPIFELDAILIDLKDQDSKLSKLSSGEKQLLGSISSVLYHLRNLNSVISKKINTVLKKENIYQYKHVNLIFEEIELYFHPEYQKIFIKYLLDRIKRIDLSNIESVNLCLVTHSPFILSDIPISNVLFLEKGNTHKFEDDNTFASNIHSLFTNHFFLRDGVIGAFAQEKIKEIVVSLLNTDSDKIEKKRIHTIINLIGEPVLKAKLLDMLNERRG